MHLRPTLLAAASICVAGLALAPTLANSQASASSSSLSFQSPTAIAISGNTAVVGNSGNNSATEFNTNTGAPVRVIRAKRYGFTFPAGITISGSNAFVVNDKFHADSVTEFNVATGTLVRVISAKRYGFSFPQELAISGSDAFVSNSTGNSVTEFNTQTGALVHVIGAKRYGFSAPTRVTVSGSNAFVVNNLGATNPSPLPSPSSTRLPVLWFVFSTPRATDFRSRTQSRSQATTPL